MIIGHQKQRGFLKKMAEGGFVSHAYLFSGEAGIGKKKVAKEWISLLLNDPGLAEEGWHPDLIFIAPEDGEIKIARVRELIRILSLRPYSAKVKAAIIDQAHLMNREAQSSLLKTLEEPTESTVLALITEHPEYLLPTISSRVEVVKFYPVAEKEIRSYLQKKGISDGDLQELVSFSQGKPGVMMNFINNPDALKDRKMRLQEVNKISNAELAVRFQYVKELAEDLHKLKEVLDIWLFHFRNSMIAMINSPENNKQALLKLKNILNQIQNTKLLVSTTNVNAKLALEVLVMQF